MDTMPSRIAAQKRLQAAQRAAIINTSYPGSSLFLRWTVLYGRLTLALVAASLASSVALLFAGTYLQFTSSSSTRTSSNNFKNLHHHRNHYLNSSLISQTLAIDLEAFQTHLPLNHLDIESSVLIFVGAISATVELLLLLSILLEHFKGSLTISLLLFGSFLYHQWSNYHPLSPAAAISSSFSTTSMIYQLVFLLACLLYTATIKVKVRLADRELLKHGRGDKEEIQLERRCIA